MVGKLIIFAILAVLAYSLFVRLKTKLTGNATPATTASSKASGEIRISKIHLIITVLAVLYLLWAMSSLYR
ncbi:MAG: hypothetical protein VW665_00460 [Candidatus Puniceispirillum sp.]